MHKMIPFLVVLGIVLLLSIAFLPGGFGIQEVMQPEEEDVENASQGSPEQEDPAQDPYKDLPQELRPALELAELLRKTPPEGKEGLLDLALRDDAVGYRANLALARSYERSDDFYLEDYYRRALAIYETRFVLEELASYLAEIGLEKEAAEIYRELLPEQNALEALLDLGIQPEALVEELAGGGYWETLAVFFRALPQEARSDRMEKYYLKAQVRTGRHDEALPGLEEVLAYSPDEPELSWHYARALELSGKPGEALPYYEAAGELGHYRQGIILESRGNHAGAADAFSAAPEPEARWRGARIWENLGEQQKALEVYMGLAETRSQVQDDAAYRAYVLLSRGDDEREHERAGDMLEVIAHSPAWMERLGKEAQRELEPQQPLQTPDFMKRKKTYRENELHRLADLELTIKLQQATAEERLALGQWYLDQENYFRAVQQGIRALNERPCLRAYRMAYLRPYMDLVTRAARDYQLDPYLLLAVMREESHYRKDVISVADARGLMQIMPTTGRDIASRKNVEFEPGMLFDPETNIRFGAWYLRSMLDMFDQDLDQSLAAYNAGPGHARRWSQSSLGSEPLGFPTAITFIETREYITKVKNSYLNYVWIYEENEQVTEQQ